MRLFRRRPLAPAVAALTLPPGDRRVAWALTEAGEPVVATEGGLLLPGRDGLLVWREVEKAAWERPRLAVRESAETAGTGVLHELVLTDEGDLPEVVRDRVTSSVAWSTYAKLGPAGGVRVVARRVPGQDLFAWQLVFDAGVDAQDPRLREAAEQLLAQARRDVG